jgi:hypothetical protein
MLFKKKLTVAVAPANLIFSLAFFCFTIPASADNLVYIVNGAQFGTMDLNTGAYSPIGSGTPQGAEGLVRGPNGSLLTLTFSGNLDSINPATGAPTIIGPTGLADCSMPSSPCGPTSANVLGQVGGQIYATDFANDLYKINPTTGHATLIGPTGMPELTFVPLSTNPDGTFNAYDESLFSVGGDLYATFDTIKVNSSTFAVTPVISPDLYQIDPLTGQATVIAPTTLGLGAVANVNGTLYAFGNSTSQVLTLNLTNGKTTVVTNFDPAAGIIAGAVAVAPEPASAALAGVGIIAAALLFRRRTHLLK